MVKRANQYFETSFLPGRSFTGGPNFNGRLVTWLEEAQHPSAPRHRLSPADRWPAGRELMLALPPVALLMGGDG
jgi:hypothetical protein